MGVFCTPCQASVTSMGAWSDGMQVGSPGNPCQQAGVGSGGGFTGVAPMFFRPSGMSVTKRQHGGVLHALPSLCVKYGRLE